MNGGHDLGGRQGFGSVNAEPESEEPLFHAEWERRIFALTLATGMLGQWNIDESRHARERQHPADYLKHSYYENWLVGLEKLLAEKDLVARIEQDAQCFRVPDAAAARRILRTGGPTLLSDAHSPVLLRGTHSGRKMSAGWPHARADLCTGCEWNRGGPLWDAYLSRSECHGAASW